MTGGGGSGSGGAWGGGGGQPCGGRGSAVFIARHTPTHTPPPPGKFRGAARVR